MTTTLKKIAFGICLCCASALTMHGTGESSEQAASGLWNEMLKAKGVSSSSPIRAFVLSLKATSGSAFQNANAGLERRTIVSSPPNGWWIFNDFRPGKLGASISVYDLTSDKAWNMYVGNNNPLQPTNPNTPGARQGREMILATFFCQAPGFTPKLLEARTRIRHNLHTYDVVKVSSNDQLVYYLDPSTHLPEDLEILISGNTTVPAYGERPAKTIFYSDITHIVMKDYHEVHGVKIPTRVKIKDSWYDVTIDINVHLPRDLFRRPPIGVSRGEDWKRQERSSKEFEGQEAVK